MELNPNLKPEFDPFLCVSLIKHHYYTGVYDPNGVAFINMMYECNRGAAIYAMETNDYEYFLYGFKQPYKLSMFYRAFPPFKHANKPEYAKAVGKLWVMSGCKLATDSMWEEIFKAIKKANNTDSLMNSLERTALHGLKETTVYLGCKRTDNPHTIINSSLSMENAKHDAASIYNHSGLPSTVFQAKAYAEDLVAAFFRNDEPELIVQPDLLNDIQECK